VAQCTPHASLQGTARQQAPNPPPCPPTAAAAAQGRAYSDQDIDFHFWAVPQARRSPSKPTLSPNFSPTYLAALLFRGQSPLPPHSVTPPLQALLPPPPQVPFACERADRAAAALRKLMAWQDAHLVSLFATYGGADFHLAVDMRDDPGGHGAALVPALAPLRGVLSTLQLNHFRFDAACAHAVLDAFRGCFPRGCHCEDVFYFLERVVLAHRCEVVDDGGVGMLEEAGVEVEVEPYPREEDPTDSEDESAHSE